jgi:NADPH2:quinone reductase
MRAAFIEETGPVEKIRVSELPDPQPGPGQVLVRVSAAALNPLDLYIRSGMVAMTLSFPYVIGCDFAGTVESVGAHVTRVRNGDRVWGSNQGLFGRQGVTAELAAIDESWVYRAPSRFSDQEAAAIALNIAKP